MKYDRYAKLNPAYIAENCSPRHIQSVIEDCQTGIASLVAQRERLLTAIAQLADMAPASAVSDIARMTLRNEMPK